ncbi:unnamed protein product [marine sediment metagenome]|uniref:Uncharacterized protein n=1 Tax=marine sediment metagenome TaxID=412755 RepID=X0VI11_9ZZZZ
MWKTVQEWFAGLGAWLTASQQTPSLEAIEDLLDENKIRAFYNVQKAHLQSGGRSRFAQILRGGGTPSDRPDQGSFVPGIPAGLDYEVHESEGPAGKGWKLIVYGMDAGVEKMLVIPHDGPPAGWVEVPSATP